MGISVIKHRHNKNEDCHPCSSRWPGCCCPLSPIPQWTWSCSISCFPCPHPCCPCSCCPLQPSPYSCFSSPHPCCSYCCVSCCPCSVPHLSCHSCPPSCDRGRGVNRGSLIGDI